MSTLPLAPVLPDEEIPITPSVEEWRAMTPQAREHHIERVIAALQQEEARMTEGRPHFRSKVSAATTLQEHFDRVGKRIYLACEMNVLYPGERAFSPDLLAVLDVDDPGDNDLRTSWVVADEGCGLDLVLEVLYSGDKHKDLITNVARYARLGIPEYFVYDCKAHKLYGYRLSGRRYLSITPRQGLLRSDVLDLSLGVLDGRLRFFHDGALIPETHEVLDRLGRLIDARDQQLSERDQQLIERDQRVAALEAELAALRARLDGARDTD